MRRCDELGRVSDEPGRLTRTFHSPAMARANTLVGGWMRDAGLEVREDAAFNLLGRWPCDANPRAKTLLLGSHLDTVPDAGKYDGPLGVLAALAAVTALREAGVRLPFAVEVVGFSDEEGVRYQTAYLGSGALAGTLARRDLARIEEKGIERARRKRSELLAYAEVHIEQGPVLEDGNLALGVVSGIAGQTRARVEFTGRAGHAGTTPMGLREDALCAAAEWIGLVERCARGGSVQVATVGQIEAHPGASNVIPGYARLSVDVRDPSDEKRVPAVRQIHEMAAAIARERGVKMRWTTVQESGSVQFDDRLSGLMGTAVRRHAPGAPTLFSGAGHDAAALAAVCPTAMMFVRCKGGVSHHPAESVKTADVSKAVAALCDFVLGLAENGPQIPQLSAD